ncbi:MAG: heavy-metal-associated domain-containing protein [Phycisphaerales bacterium]|nr:heavy-metal-associated domain-containing protein [Phycisphaerales bacterium]
MTRIQNHQSTVSLRIGGMNCDHCVRAVKSALASVPGLKVDAVSLGSATVEWAAQPVIDRAIEVVRDAGFDAAVDRTTALGGSCCAEDAAAPGNDGCTGADASPCCGV